MLRIILVLSGLLSLVQAQPTRKVAFVLDEGQSFKQLAALIQTELNTLSRGRFLLEYTEPLAPVEGAVNIILGAQQSQAALALPPFPAPLIVGTLLDPGMQGLPPSPETGSGVPGLNYIQPPFDVVKDLVSLREMVPFSQLAMVMDARLVEISPEIVPRLKTMAKAGEQITIIPFSGESWEQLKDKLPEGCDAIYLLPLSPNQTRAERKFLDRKSVV